MCHRYTRVPHPEPPSFLPPHTIPLGHPSAPAPSIQHHALNLDWRFISYMILHMFQYHSPKSSHPPLPQSPKDCSLFLRLPSRDRAPSLPLLSLFLSFIFFLPPFEDNRLLFWVPEVLCRHSKVVSWNFLSV